MEIRVAVPDATGAKSLVRRLAELFEPTSVSLDADRHEVSIEAPRGTSQAVVQVLGSVEDWLEEAGAAAATVWLGERSYTLVPRQAQPASGQ